MWVLWILHIKVQIRKKFLWKIVCIFVHYMYFWLQAIIIRKKFPLHQISTLTILFFLFQDFVGTSEFIKKHQQVCIKKNIQIKYIIALLISELRVYIYYFYSISIRMVQLLNDALQLFRWAITLITCRCSFKTM